MGGMTIMSLAEEHPEWFGDRVVGVALFATSSGHMNEVSLGLPTPAAGFVHSHTSELAALAKANREVIELGRHHISDLTYALTHTYSFGSNYSQNRTQFVADMIASTPIDVIADFAPHLTAHDKQEALAALQSVETLVMVGDRDLVTPHHHSVEIVRHIPGAELVIVPATGHMIIIERYHDVNRYLLELIDAVRDESTVLEGLLHRNVSMQHAVVGHVGQRIGVGADVSAGDDEFIRSRCSIGSNHVAVTA